MKKILTVILLGLILFSIVIAAYQNNTMMANIKRVVNAILTETSGSKSIYKKYVIVNILQYKGEDNYSFVVSSIYNQWEVENLGLSHFVYTADSNLVLFKFKNLLSDEEKEKFIEGNSLIHELKDTNKRQILETLMKVDEGMITHESLSIVYSVINGQGYEKKYGTAPPPPGSSIYD